MYTEQLRNLFGKYQSLVVDRAFFEKQLGYLRAMKAWAIATGDKQDGEHYQKMIDQCDVALQRCNENLGLVASLFYMSCDQIDRLES